LGWRRWIAWCAVGASATVLVAGVVAAFATVEGSTLALGSLLRADALTAVMLLVIGSVSVIATWASVGYIDGELRTQTTTARGARRYAILVPLFISTMAGTVLAANLGVMWAGIEATTIVTAFLVGHHGGRRAVEATWKYVIICSVGIALAYLGTVLVYYASQHSGGTTGREGTLDWSELVAHADRLDPGVMRIAVGLVALDREKGCTSRHRRRSRNLQSMNCPGLAPSRSSSRPLNSTEVQPSASGVTRATRTSCLLNRARGATTRKVTSDPHAIT
ncbi:MAG: hypothetical protein CVT68_12940, partial [Actinobacteria bacterium HGW-Actinobacteria-8]